MQTQLYQKQLGTMGRAAFDRADVFIIGLNCGFWREAVEKLEKEGYRISRFEDFADFLTKDFRARSGVVVIDHADNEGAAALFEHCRSYDGRLAPILASRSIAISSVVHAIKAGAVDVVREGDGDDLSCSVREAHARMRAMEDERHSPLVLVGIPSGLTKRQSEILARILKGQPNKIIAADLGISQRTAENHRALIMKKMGASSLSNLVTAAISAPARGGEHPSFAPSAPRGADMPSLSTPSAALDVISKPAPNERRWSL